MKVGDLVRFIGGPWLYRNRVGVVVRFDMYGPLVHFAGLEGRGRDADGFAQCHDGLHPMCHDELEVVDAGR